MSKDISPSAWSAGVGIAEPKRDVKGFALIGTLLPQLRSDYGCVAPDVNCLFGVTLMFIYNASAARLPYQVGFCVGLAVPGHEDEIVCEDSIHGGRVVFFHRRLIFCVEHRYGLFVFVPGTAGAAN